MPPYGLYSLTDRVNLPEELAAEGYRNIDAFSPGLDSGFRQSLYQYDPAFGQLNASQRYLAAPYTGPNPFQAMFDISPTYFEGTNIGQLPYDIPSYGGVSGYRDTGGIMGIMQEEEDEEDQLPYSGVGDMRYQTPRTIADQNRILGQTFTPQPKSFRDSATLQEYFENRNPVTGIMNLLSKLPTPMNILRGGLGSLRNLNNRIQQSDFGQSKTLVEYLQKRKDRKAAEEAARRGSIQELQSRIDRGDFGGGEGGGGGGFQGHGGYGSSAERGGALHG